MISPEIFYNSLIEIGINNFTGVPDSLLKYFCAYLQDNSRNHIIAANEGNAIAIAAGEYLGTGKPSLVYMQNSGLGNAVNPLVSLMDKKVYGIPVLLLIGWRGEPGVKDEPQHVKQGEITLQLLEVLGIKYSVLDSESSLKLVIKFADEYLKKNEVYAIVVRKDCFSEYKLKNKNKDVSELSRETVIKYLCENLLEENPVISTTGMISRELFEVRELLKTGHEHDFLTVGSMGHTSQIAFGLSLAKENKKIFCLDGDGSMLMHLGGCSVIAQNNPGNLVHIVLNNAAHDSVGGQPTICNNIPLFQIAKLSGYKYSSCVNSQSELEKEIKVIKNTEGTVFLEIKVKKGARSDLGRPTLSPQEIKTQFMGNI